MRATFLRIGRDLLHRRNIDAYAIALAAFVAAVGAALNDIAPEQFKWSILLAAVALMVYRLTIPERSAIMADELLKDRTDFVNGDLQSRMRRGKEVWIFAPSGVGILSDDTCQLLRESVLAHPHGVVRIAVLDANVPEAVSIAARQLDDSLDFPLQDLPTGLNSTLAKLATMTQWNVAGTFEYRKFGYNPGFSIVAVDPSTRHGFLIVEFHGVQNDSVARRMHVELTRKDSDRWYIYWVNQFHRIWQLST